MDIYSLLFGNSKNLRLKSETIDDYNNNFKLPIEYLDDKNLLNDCIINDLELKEYKSQNNATTNTDHMDDNYDDISNNNNKENLYYCLLNPHNIFEKNIVNKWSKYYTSNKDFLLESQNLLKHYKPNIDFVNIEAIDAKDISNSSEDISLEESILNNCENIIYDNGFIEKYQYFELPFFSNYNNNSSVLTGLSVYNLAAPAFSLILPIISMIIPFFIIKLQGYDVTLESYISHLKIVLQNHVIGQLFTNFSEASFSTKIYLILSVFFYGFQIYQNVFSCIKYFKNIKLIHTTLFEVRKYLKNSIKRFSNLLKYTNDFKSYTNFNESVNKNNIILTDYYNQLEKINDYNFNTKKVMELGNLLKSFYQLNNDDDLINSLYFSFNCNGYIDNIVKIQKLVKNNKINYCNFASNNENTVFKNSYYGHLINSEKIVKNSYDLSKNMILTGPNAAGKTTLLKSSIFNIILCQQFGCGFFEEATINLYDYIHCYINIPDTSNRDSLFQAEARQCKKILELIEEKSDKRHFCVFDELYSGTNPDEAVSSAFNYLKHLDIFNNLDYILTTHYNKLCKKLEKSKSNVTNYCMTIKQNDSKSDFEYTYKLKKGISKVKGGIKVLKDLNYPKEIINDF